VLLAWSIFYRESESEIVTCWATCLFIVLSWWRLWQLRPDLASIPATLLLYRVLLERDRAVTWFRVGIAAVLLLAWANFHSLFAVGLGLLVAALLGRVLGDLLGRATRPPQPPVESAPEVGRRATSRLAAALGIGVLVTLVNPRGFRQYLTFDTSSRQSAIWSVTDEWKHYDPLAWRPDDHAVSLTAWLTMQILLVAFLVVAGIGLVRLAQRRSTAQQHPVALGQFGLALVSVVAILVSVRFLWMSVFILLYLVRAWRVHYASTVTTPCRWGFAGTAKLLALTFPVSGSFQVVAERIPTDFPNTSKPPTPPGGCTSKPWASSSRPAPGAIFTTSTPLEIFSGTGCRLRSVPSLTAGPSIIRPRCSTIIF